MVKQFLDSISILERLLPVDYYVLLQKCEIYGIKGKNLQLIPCYLTNRRQVNFVNNKSSTPMEISSGVPQGSVLGPLLFIIYMNDLQNAIPNIPLQLFADDTTILLSRDSSQHLITKAEETLTKVKKWFDCNKLILHLGKTTHTIFQSKKQSLPPDQYFTLDGTNIYRAYSTKYLGLYIDENLTWRNHIDHLNNSLIKYIGIFTGSEIRFQQKQPHSFTFPMFTPD